jgi:hypothetical protein
VHDLQLSKNGFGAFVRFKYWYDFELEKGDRPHGSSITAYQPNIPLGDAGLENNSKFAGVALLDAYVYGTFDIADVPVDVRIGRQVLSWGESTFIQGGMNSTNPFDVAALRRPGAELKEGILPVGMFYLNAGLTDNLSMEGFYQYEWEKTQIDNCGTLFSTADFAASGCDAVTVLAFTDQEAMEQGYYAERQADKDPDDAGQYGLAMRYYSPALNDTEFGLYYMNIHSRAPVINAIRTSIPGGTVFVNSGNESAGILSELNPAYLIEFPEDLKYYGFSFATNVASMALSGEITYKPDTPVQINGAEVLNGVLSEQPYFRYTERVTAVDYGGEVKGYDEFDITQMQITALQFFDRALGATRVTLIAEAGMVMTKDVED